MSYPIIQPALPQMAPVASALVYLTMGKMADYLLGADSARKARRLLAALFRSPVNRFSYRLSDVAVVSGRVVGLILSYPTRLKAIIELPTAADLIRFGGLLHFLRIVHRSLPFIPAKESEGEAWFISNLAVSPEYQGQGIGRRLLETIAARARAQGLRALALTVDVENERAISFYRRLGFRITGTATFPTLHRKLGYRGFHRMTRFIP